MAIKKKSDLTERQPAKGSLSKRIKWKKMFKLIFGQDGLFKRKSSGHF
jgi:hypothetical protein